VYLVRSEDAELLEARLCQGTRDQIDGLHHGLVERRTHRVEERHGRDERGVESGDWTAIEGRERGRDGACDARQPSE